MDAYFFNIYFQGIYRRTVTYWCTYFQSKLLYLGFPRQRSACKISWKLVETVESAEIIGTPWR